VSHLEKLVDTSIYILRETRAQFKNPCFLWSTGKDSTVMLILIRESFFGEVPWDVVHIDTGWKFPEIYEFREKICKEWNLPLVVVKSPLAGKINPEQSKVSHYKCCQKLKTDVLRYTIEQNGSDAVVVSIRRDEHYVRNFEHVSSPRDKKFRWNLLRRKRKNEEGDAPFLALQETELWDLYPLDFGKLTTSGDTYSYIGQKSMFGNTLKVEIYRTILFIERTMLQKPIPGLRVKDSEVWDVRLVLFLFVQKHLRLMR
jgi:3'-phosphoadenosine 5'-phosphosulfate sulfotransferase (PAPS reductase)/FAD synthetase